MNQAPLTLYKSSAGSGKTFTLVKEYLRLCLEEPARFKKVVAITFTNAAAAEMKERILQRLKSLSAGNDQAFEDLLRKDGVSEQGIKNAPLLLEKILYNYSYFNIGTIDSFFHRILRAFSKELGLPMGFDIFLESDDALSYAVDNLLHRSHTQADVHKVLTAFVQEKVNNGQSWHIREDLVYMAHELLKDNAMLRGETKLEDIFSFARELREIIHEFEKEMDAIGRDAISQLGRMGFTADNFSNKASGPIGFFFQIQRSRKDYEPKTRIKEAMENPVKWLTAATLKSPEGRALEQAVETILMPAAEEAIRLKNVRYPVYQGAKEVYRSIYTYAVYEELNKILVEYRTEKEVVLISDFTKILARHILHEDIGFVYSKLGARYEHFLIDEFQDTSSLQWFGLKPLIENSVSQGSDCLVVGDSKQAIYRWRGGEVELIEQGISERDFPDYSRELRLSHNFRSGQEIIAFNNRFFNDVSRLFSADRNEFQTLRRIFQDTTQEHGSGNNGGYIEVNFIQKEGNRKDTYMARAEEVLLEQLKTCLADGFALRDIAVLVRSGSEASSLARLFIDNRIPFITQDSLSIDHSPTVRLLFSLLSYLDNPSDELAKAQSLFLYITYFTKTEQPVPLQDIVFGLDAEPGSADTLQHSFPAEFTERFAHIANLPVYEIVEECVRIFGLNAEPDAYLQRFQDLVLEFSQTQGFGIRAFIDWWKEGRYSVILPEDQDAIRIMTIHKSKGLEYPVVMIPYANWDFKSGRGDLIWVESDEAPFNRFSALPVYASEGLKESVFSQDYIHEQSQVAIDNLNLLYVAFTRARERLYISTQTFKDIKDEYKNIGQVISAILRLPGTQAQEKKMVFGEPRTKSGKEEKSKATDSSVSLAEYTSTDWREKVKIRTGDKDII